MRNSTLPEGIPPLADAWYRWLVTDVIDYGVVILDPAGYIQSWNRGAASVTGHTADAIIGQHVAVLYPADYQASRKPLQDLAQARQASRFQSEDWRLRQDGSVFLAEMVLTPLWDAGGQLQAYALLLRDITVQQREEDRFQRVVEYSPSAMVMVNPSGLIEMVNTQTERMFGYSRAEILGQTVECLLPTRFRRQHPAMRQAFFHRPSPRPMGAGRELYGLHRDGSEFPIEIGLNPIETDAGMMVLSVIVDISARKRLEQRFRQVVQEAPNAMIMVNAEGRIMLFNRQAEQTFGYEQHQMIGQLMELLVPQRFRQAHPSLRSGYHSNPEARPMGAGRELYGLHKDGSEFPVEIGLNPIDTEEGTMVLAAIVDITSRKTAQRQIETALKEKTVLLNEVHHRVKNNLQVIISLLNMQAHSEVDENARNVLSDTQARVRSMSLIHQLLYEGSDFSRVDLGEYLQRFGQLLLSSFGVLNRKITLHIDAPTRLIYIELQRATPCGLLINELVTNAFKHAYPDQPGSVWIRLSQDGPDHARLQVADQGVGLPPAPTLKAAKTLGLRLVPVLTDQIGGVLSIQDNQPGACFEVRFPVLEGNHP